MSDEFKTVSKKKNTKTGGNKTGGSQFMDEKKKNIDPLALKLARWFYQDDLVDMPFLPIERDVLLAFFNYWWARQEDVPAREEVQFAKVLFALAHGISILRVVGSDGIEWKETGIWWRPRKIDEEPLFPHHKSPKNLKIIRSHHEIAKSKLFKELVEDDDEVEEEKDVVVESETTMEDTPPPPPPPSWGRGDTTLVRQPPPEGPHPSPVSTFRRPPQQRPPQQQPPQRHHQESHHHHQQNGGGGYPRSQEYSRSQEFSRYPRQQQQQRQKFNVDPISEECAQKFWTYLTTGEHYFVLPELREQLEECYREFNNYMDSDLEKCPEFSKVLFALAHGNIVQGHGVLKVVGGSRLLEF